ncbi:MAG TPA: hypothetical protein VFR46_04320, partial [Actinomycetes bacterium]|nr:hypothetical protein [Actinomycetes bacterium]
VLTHAGSRRLIIWLVTAVSLVVVAGGSVAMAGGQAQLAAVRAATERFHDLDVAKAAGYGAFYMCTDHVTDGTMGQHYVRGAIVGDGAIDALQPEALVYEPRRGGGYRLVGVEYVVFADAWDAQHDDPPSLFGRTFSLIQAGNRYGLPDFYELHAWIWRPNPSGMFNDWNPKVSCRGMGDPA